MAIALSAISTLAIALLAISILANALSAISIWAIGHSAISILAINEVWQWLIVIASKIDGYSILVYHVVKNNFANSLSAFNLASPFIVSFLALCLFTMLIKTKGTI